MFPLGLYVTVGMVLACFTSNSTADDARMPTYSRARLSIGGGAQWVGTAEVNGDGLLDLVVQRKRTLTVYFNTQEKGFSLAAQTDVDLPEDAFVFQFADVDGDRGEELVFLQPLGVGFLDCHEGRFEKPPGELLSIETIFRGKCTGRPLQKNFLVRANGDEQLDIVVPTRKGFVVLLGRGKGAYNELTKVEMLPLSGSQFISGLRRKRRLFLPSLRDRLVVSQSCPAFSLADFDGDGANEFAVYQNGVLSVHGLFGQNAGKVVGAFAIDACAVPERKRERLVSFDIPPFIGDMNGDGLADVVRTLASGGKTFIFLCRRSPDMFAEPDTIIKVDGWTPFAWPCDVNGDGRNDLVLVKVEKLGVWSALQVLVTKTIDLDLYVYLCGSDGRYRDVPDYSRTLNVPLVMAFTGWSFRLETPFIVNFTGDFDGDGRKDLLVKTAPDKLSVFAGQDKEVFSDRASLELQMLDTGSFSSTEVILCNLDEKQGLDILLCHKDFENRTNWIELFTSR